MTVKQKFRINPHLTVKLEDTNPNSYRDWTVIYVDGNEFIQCHYLMVSITEESLPHYNSISSIDDLEELLDNSHERNPTLLTPEEEYLGHCSNLQAWYGHHYDTRLLHRNLAFPLLKKLAVAGDSQAKRAFKEGIAKRIMSGAETVIKYLIIEGYIEFFSREEWNSLAHDFPPHIKNLIIKSIIHVLKTVGTEHDRKEKLYDCLTNIDNDQASKLQYIEYNGEKFFVKDGTLKIHPTKDKKKKIESIWQLKGLDKLTELKALIIKNQKISDLKGIDYLTSLECLNLQGNEISKIEHLENMFHLKELSLKGNLIEKIEGIENLANLETLRLSQNFIDEIKNLEGLLNLTNLHLGRNKIREITNLEYNPNLETVYLGWNKLTDVPDLESMKNLKKIHLSGNQISTYKLRDLEKELPFEIIF